MRRISALLAAVIACLAIGSVAVAAKKKSKRVNVQSSITFQIANTPANVFSPGAATYSGAITAGGPEGCTIGRAVTILRDGVPHTGTVSEPDGSYRVTVAAAAPPGTYTASVPERRVKEKRKGKKKTFVCAAATTSPVAIP
jgi:hypothetical protein